MALEWFRLMIKRLLSRKAFIAFLFLFPLSAFALKGLGEVSEEKLTVGIVWEDSSELSARVGEKLLQAEGFVQFIRLKDRAEAERAAASQRVAWAYLLPSDLQERFQQDKNRRIITVLEPPSAPASKLTDEVVFGAIMGIYGETILVDYAEESGLIKEKDLPAAIAQITQSYQEYRDKGGTFSFEYRTVQGEAKEVQTILTAPVRGIGAVLILISGLLGAILYSRDEKKGLFARLSPKKRKLMSILWILASGILTALAVILGMAFADSLQNIFREILWMAAYIWCMVGYVSLLRALLKDTKTLCGALPMLSMSAVVFGPVFFDIGAIAKAIAPLGYLFPSTYYLKASLGMGSGMLMMLLLGTLLMFAGIFVKEI